MKANGILLFVLFIFGQAAWGQRRPLQVGVNVVPLFDRTLEVSATFLGTAEHDFFIHGGYSFPKYYPTTWEGSHGRSWEGKSSGAYLRVGARAFLNKTGRVKGYLGPHLTVHYLNQAGKSAIVINCIIGPCPPIEREGRSDDYALSGGITGGVRTNILPRLTLDVGVQANRFVFEKPVLATHDVSIPGYGRRVFQSTVSVQYTLKSR